MAVGGMGWKEVHSRLVELAQLRGSVDYEEAMLLIAARRWGIHARVGYGSLLEYVERTLGHQPKVARERLRVAEALGDLPRMGEALRTGKVSWSAVRELTRVAVADTEEEWLAAVAGKTVRDVEERVSGYLPGDRPSDEPSDEARRHVLRMEISAATLALFREAREQLVRDAGGGLEDDEVLCLMARQVLGGPAEGRASYQIATFVCERCERGWQDGGGERVAVAPAVVAQARCDGQVVGSVLAEKPERATQEVPPAVRRQVLLRDHGKCRVDGCKQSAWVDVHHIELRSEGGGNDPENLAVTCSVHHAAIHQGRLVVTGRASSRLTFRHADGTPYGGRPDAAASDAASDAFLALRSLGYKEKDARRAVGAVMPHVGREAGVVEILKQGLAALRVGLNAQREPRPSRPA